MPNKQQLLDGQILLMIQYEYQYHDKVLRIMPGDNPGVTILVLKELY